MMKGTMLRQKTHFNNNDNDQAHLAHHHFSVVVHNQLCSDQAVVNFPPLHWLFSVSHEKQSTNWAFIYVYGADVEEGEG